MCGLTRMPTTRGLGVCIDQIHRLTGLINQYIMHLTLDIMFCQEVKDPLEIVSWIYLQDIILARLEFLMVIISGLKDTPKSFTHQALRSKLDFIHQSVKVCTKLSE